MGINYVNPNEIMLSRQSIQNRYIKIDLLDYNFQSLDSLEGICIDGNMSINADSDIRRTANLNLVIKDKSFEAEPGGKIWIDKYIKLWVGVYNLKTNNIDWTNCGIYIIDEPNYHYDCSSNTLSISLLDLMAKMTGLRNGYLKGLPVLFKAGENLRNAIIETLKFSGFNKYIVNAPPEPNEIPFDLNFSQGATVYELLKGLVDIYPGYEMFFDVNGTFIYQKIPDGKNNVILADDKVWNSIVISEDISPNFNNIKNSIEVYGRVHNPAKFSTETTVDINNIIHLTINGVENYTDGMIYGFVLTDNLGYNEPEIQINNLLTIPLKFFDGVTNPDIQPEEGEVYYCIRYKANPSGQPYFEWLGHLQAYAVAEDVNPKSPYYINGPVGKIRLPLYGGEYDNIVSDDLALERAKYELYLHAQLNDSINLTCVPQYWFDVNNVVEYTTRRNGDISNYIIKSINVGFGSTETMTLNMMKLYPESEN